jgi:hypothetical protein
VSGKRNQKDDTGRTQSRCSERIRKEIRKIF